jgi:hypothetical protein
MYYNLHYIFSTYLTHHYNSRDRSSPHINYLSCISPRGKQCIVPNFTHKLSILYCTFGMTFWCRSNNQQDTRWYKYHPKGSLTDCIVYRYLGRRNHRFSSRNRIFNTFRLTFMRYIQLDSFQVNIHHCTNKNLLSKKYIQLPIHRSYNLVHNFHILTSPDPEK